MDYTSFAPGNNSINNSVPSPAPQYSVPKPKHFLNKKFIVTFVILLLFGAGAYAEIWYWQSRQIAQEVVPTFTPRADGSTSLTTSWKTYTNTQYGFELKYPADWVFKNYNFGDIFQVAIDPQKVATQKDLETLDMLSGLVSIRIEKCPTQGGCHVVIGYDSLKAFNIGWQMSIEAKKLETSFGNNASNPSYNGKHEISYYFDFGKNSVYRATITYVSDASDKYLNEFNQILSTFKFTPSTSSGQAGSVDTSTWKTYTNTQYGFEFKYLGTWPAPTSYTTLVDSFLGIGKWGYVFGPKKDIEGIMVSSYVMTAYPSSNKATIIQKIKSSEQYKGGLITIKDTPAIIATLPAIRYDEGGLCGFPTAVIFTQSYTLKLVSYCNNESTDPFNQILSTFKFTK